MRVAGLFAVSYLVVTPLPHAVLLEAPFLGGFLPWLVALAAAPAFAGTMALIAATRVLARAHDGPGSLDCERFPWGPAIATGLLSAALASGAFFIPLLGFLLVVLLMPVLFGPPIVGQVVATRGSSLGSAVSEARSLLAGETQRVVLYLVNVAAGIGLLAMIFVGGADYAALRSGEPLQALLESLYKAVVLGVLAGFLACVEFVIYADLQARPATANQD